jgi:hypothetical protein
VGQAGHVDEVGIAAQLDRDPPADLGDLRAKSVRRCPSVPGKPAIFGASATTRSRSKSS